MPSVILKRVGKIILLRRGNKPPSVNKTSTVNRDFPEATQWALLVDAKNNDLTFNIQNIVSLFIERKAKDNESNKDY